MKTLTAGFLTTLNARMARTALAFLLLPWRWGSWRSGSQTDLMAHDLQKYLNAPNLPIPFWNGRSALFHALKLLKIGEGDEVLVQAYTCVSVANAIVQTSATPIYCDVENESLNIDPADIEQKISAKTKVVIVQHTFGVPAQLEQIKQICDKHNLFLLEDCAHALGSEYRSQKCGTWGDVAIFSTGRDKVISSVTGGFLIINHPDLHKKFMQELAKTPLQQPPVSLVLRALLYPPLALLARATYSCGLGKVIMLLSRSFHLFPEILSPSEKECENHQFNWALPACLAQIGRAELAKIDHTNAHRERIAQLYEQQLDLPRQKITPHSRPIFLRYTLFCDRSADLMSFAKSQKVILGDWYRQVIAPTGVDLAKTKYRPGSCPRAEKLASRTINLPNHAAIDPSDALRVVALITDFYAKNDH